MICVGHRGVGSASGCPTICGRIVCPAGVEKDAVVNVRPRQSFHCQSKLPCVSSRRRRVASIGIQLLLWDHISRLCRKLPGVRSAPDDHFTACPDRGVRVSVVARWWCWWRSNYSSRILSAAGIENSGRQIPPKRSSHCQSRLPCELLGQRARWWCLWLSNCRCRDCIFRRCSNSCCSVSAPNDHFSCRSRLPCGLSASRRVGGAVAVQLFVLGSYRPPVLKMLPSYPPQTTISLPVQIAV